MNVHSWQYCPKLTISTSHPLLRMKGTVIPLLKNKARLNLHPLTLSSSIQPTYASAGHSRQYPNHTISMQLYTTMAFIAFSRTNSWILCQMGSPEVDTVVNESLSSMLQAMSMEIIHKTPPVYHYCSHFYYLGMQILPIYQWSSLTINHQFQFDEVLPFIESHLAPDVFNPLFSQMHWKEGQQTGQCHTDCRVHFLSHPQGEFGRGCCSCTPHSYMGG